ADRTFFYWRQPGSSKSAPGRTRHHAGCARPGIDVDKRDYNAHVESTRRSDSLPGTSFFRWGRCIARSDKHSYLGFSADQENNLYYRPSDSADFAALLF